MCVLRNMFVSLSCVDDCNVHVSHTCYHTHVCVTIRMCVLPYACVCYHTHVCVTIRMCVLPYACVCYHTHVCVSCEIRWNCNLVCTACLLLLVKVLNTESEFPRGGSLYV